MKVLVNFVCALLLATTVFAQTNQPSVVLISIDGLKPDYILNADQHKLKIPHLRRILAEGAHAKAVTGVLPTVTYPSHTTMVTGVSPSKHGIFYNSPFDPFGQNQSGWMWYAEDIKSLTLWEAVNKAGGISSSVDWPVTVGAPIRYNIAQFWRATTEDDYKLLKALSTPGLLAEAEKAVGRYPAGYLYTIAADNKRADFNAWVIANKQPLFHTAYFSVLDEVQHAQGPYTQAAYETIEAIDAMIGKVWQAALQANKNAVVCVVSDHGFAPYKNALSVNAALRQAGLLTVENGKLKDWQAISWGGGGSTAVMLKNNNDDATREKVRSVLQQLAADPANGIHRVITNAEARQMGGFPEAAFIVGMKPGFATSGSFDVVLQRNIKGGGSHGYLRELPEMDSSFFIAGARVPQGKVFDRIDMRDIAPTLAGLLGVRLPNAEGRNLLP